MMEANLHTVPRNVSDGEFSLIKVHLSAVPSPPYSPHLADCFPRGVTAILVDCPHILWLSNKVPVT